VFQRAQERTYNKEDANTKKMLEDEEINGNERKRMKGKQRRESHMAIKLY